MNFKLLRRWLPVFILGIALIVVYKAFDNLYFIWQSFLYLLAILTPVFWGFGIAYLLYPAAVRMEKLYSRFRLKYFSARCRAWSVLTLYMIVISILTITLTFTIRPLSKNITDFVLNLPILLRSTIDFINSSKYIALDTDEIMSYISITRLMQLFNVDALNMYAGGLAKMSSGFFNVFLAVIISIYILIDRASLKLLYTRITKVFAKPDTRELISKYIIKINEFIYKYLLCQVIASIVAGVASFIVLKLMGVTYAPSLSLMIAVFNMVPYFGALISAIIAALITAMVSGPMMAVWVSVALLIIQQVDGNVIQPNLLSNSLDISPFWVIVGVIIGGAFFGIVGVILAAPFMALLRIMVNDLFEYIDKRREGHEKIRE